MTHIHDVYCSNLTPQALNQVFVMKIFQISSDFPLDSVQCWGWTLSLMVLWSSGQLLSQAHIPLASETPNTLVWPNQPPRIVPFYLAALSFSFHGIKQGPAQSRVEENDSVGPGVGGRLFFFVNERINQREMMKTQINLHDESC